MRYADGDENDERGIFPPFRQYGVGESNRIGSQPGYYMNGNHLNESLGKTQYSHNFNRSMLRNMLG